MLMDFWVFSSNDNGSIYYNGAIMFINLLMSTYWKYTEIQLYHIFKSWLIGKDPDAGKDWGQEEKGMTEDEMVGWHHQLNGHEFAWTLGVVDGQGGLACCGSWDRKQSDTTWAAELNWTE